MAAESINNIRAQKVYRLQKNDPRLFYTIPIRLPHSGDLKSYREELDCRCTYYRKLIEELATQSKEKK